MALTEEWVGCRRTIAAQDAQSLHAGNNLSATESGSPSTTRALPLKPVRKADEEASKPAGNGRSAQMLAYSCRPPGQPRSRLRAWRALYRQNRYAKPMELPPNLVAVYLEKFKRALARASCRRPTWEFWQ